ncbi:MAG: TRAP transporter substrate-binding protein, partial [Desulfovibrionales bacterium]
MKSWIATPLALLMLCLLLPAPGQAGERLSYSCFFPPTHDQAKLAEKWCREVKARTNGEVTVDFYPGGTLTSAKECYDGVAQGISDIGFSVLGYTRGRFPVMAAVDLPMGYRSGREATEVANSVYKRFRPDEFNDVHVLYFHAHGPGILHTADKPVKTLEDLKGMKIRATGNSGKLIGALGGTPVAMSMPDSYQSIRKGIVDGGIYPVETNKGWKMAEVVDYMTESYPVAYTTTFFVVMNKDRWNSLSEEAQKAITEISAEWIPKHGRVWDESDKAGREYFLDQGGQIIPLPTREADRWKERAQSLVDAYVREVGSKGLNG